MSDRDYKAFIVEGEDREPRIINNILKIFFKQKKFKIITLPAEQNIYMLWKRLKEDDFETDIIEVLREEHEALKKQLTGIGRDDFSEIYLFFDYDGHQNNLGAGDDVNVLEQMLKCFDNETENGKLYISYPMVEALRDFEPGVCGKKGKCFVTMEESKQYKLLSASPSIYSQFNSYKFEMWKELIDVFSMRVSCLMKRTDTITYEQYIEMVNPYEIFKLQREEIGKNRIFVLSSFPEFLLDYFGVKLWKRCVKHAKNSFGQNMCRD